MMEEEQSLELTPFELEQIRKNGERLLVLWRGFPESHFFRAWQRFGLGCVTRAYHTLRRLLETNDDGPDSVTLARALFDHVVAVAWMAEDPEVRFPMVFRKGLASACVMGAEIYRAGSSVVDPETLEMLRRDADGPRAPSTQEQAHRAETYWTSRLPDWGWGFAHQYSSLFRSYSLCVHPTHLGLEAFFDDQGRIIFDPTDAGMGNVRAQAVACFADALVISSQLFGWPRFDDVMNVYTLGMLD